MARHCSALVKVEPHEDNFIIENPTSRPNHKSKSRSARNALDDDDDDDEDIHTDLASFVSSQARAPPAEVPLRATQAPKRMKGMMGVFRINPFAIHGGLAASTAGDDAGARAVMPTMCWEPGPLDEEPLMLEFQLELVGYGVDGDEDDESTGTKDVLDSESVLLELATMDDQLQSGYDGSSTIRPSSLRLHTFSPDFDVHDDFASVHVTRYTSTPISVCHTEDHQGPSLVSLGVCASCSGHDDGSGTVTALLPPVPPPPSSSSSSSSSASSSSPSSLVVPGNEGDIIEYVQEFPSSTAHQHQHQVYFSPSSSSRGHWTTMDMAQRQHSPQQQQADYEYDPSAGGEFQEEHVQVHVQQAGMSIQTEIQQYATTTRGHISPSQSQDSIEPEQQQQQPCSFASGTMVVPMVQTVSQDHHHHQHHHQHHHHHPIPIPIQPHLAQSHIRASGIGANGLGLYTPAPTTSTNVPTSPTSFDVPRPTSTASTITQSTGCATSPPLPALPPPLPPLPGPLGCVAVTPPLSSLSSESSESTSGEVIGDVVPGVGVDEPQCSMSVPGSRRMGFTSVGSTHLHLGGYGGYGQPSASYHRSQQHQQQRGIYDHHYHPYLRPISSQSHHPQMQSASQHYLNSRSYRGREYHQCGSSSPSTSGGYYSTALGSGEYSDAGGVGRQTGSEVSSSSAALSTSMSSSSHAYTCTTY